MSNKSLSVFSGFFRRRIFFKYILVTLLIGITINALVLVVYYQRRQNEQTGQIAAEIATIANRIGRPASTLSREGNDARARELLSVFAAYPYVICADLKLDGKDQPATSWPIIGCERIKKPGRDIDVELAAAGTEAKIGVRINQGFLAARLRDEFLVLMALGVAGGLSLILAGIAGFLWFINRPLRLLLTAIKRFDKYAEPQHVGYSSEDEIGQVVNSYNSMIDREVERVSEIRNAHLSILDSVNYAARIQRGLLPTRKQLDVAFAECSVLWEPRDLVGGDIYWIHSDAQRTTIALIDCTGHGVPGGFMTMLAIASLERIFSEDETLSPREILSRLSDLTQGLLNQDSANPESNDGMDAAVCQFKTDANEGIFAGARQSLIICSAGDVTRVRGNRMSLGYADVPARPYFRETSFPVVADTKLFLYSDGVIDQPGGQRQIAFGNRRLAEIIKAHEPRSLDNILAAIEREFSDYAGSEKRRDDLTVLAFSPKQAQSIE